MSETKERTSRLMMYLTDAMDNTPEALEVISFMLGYKSITTFQKDVEAFYNYMREANL